MLTSWLFRRSYRRFCTACHAPLRAQAQRLRHILRQAAHTGVGQANDFAGLARIVDPVAMIREYQRRVPVRTCTEMRADLDAVYAGDWQRLCPSTPMFFAMTAGSTGQFKFIPITEEFRREVGEGSQIFYGALESAYPSLRGLKCQFLVGSAEGGMTPGQIPRGFASGFNYKHLPWLLRRRFVLPYWIFTLHDAEDRAYAAGRLMVAERRLGALCAISPVNIINVHKALERHAERLIADVEAGTLTLHGTAAVPGSYRGNPNHALADDLRHAWRRGGRLPAKLLFPSLQVLVCWQGGNMGYYLHELGERFDHVNQFEFPISASEALFAIPREGNRAGGVLAVTSHFLEFISADPDAGAGTALRADQLQVGATYRVVVTTSGGLYRYDMEDLIRVTGTFGQTPVIAFVSKADRRVSVSNERLSELDVTEAMRAASGATDSWFDDFLFVPCADRRYRVILDGAAVTHDSALEAFATELERQLRITSRGYDFEREDALLEPLRLFVTAPGELKSYLASRQAQHALPNAQLKPMRLTSEFDVHTTFQEVNSHAVFGH
jgi:hypothetical protein